MLIRLKNRNFAPKILAHCVVCALLAQPLRRELQKVESEMEALGSEKTALETQLTQAMPAAEIAQAGRRLKAVSDQLDALEERWLSLSEQIEQATA